MRPNENDPLRQSIRLLVLGNLIRDYDRLDSFPIPASNA